MSLMNAVTKLAVGFAVAKGVQAVNQRGGIGAVMKDLQGAASNRSASMGGLGDLLGQLSGGSASSGGLGGLLQQLGGGSSASGSLAGLGGLLGGLADARGGGMADKLEALLAEDNPSDEPDEDETALLMLRAMLYAARADGDIDPEEKEKLKSAFQDTDSEDIRAVEMILQEPVDAGKIVRDTPKGLETQVYTMALNAIDPDNRAEAEYLHALAQGFNLNGTTVNGIHDSMGAARIYR